MRELRFMLFIVAAMLWNTVTAYDFEVDGIYYNIISSVDKTVEVSGYVRNIGFKGNIVIPERINGYSVTTIGNYAFKACRSLTGINIPNSVVNIGWDAFYSCRNLKTVFNCSGLEISKGSSSNGYVGFYAEKVIKADGQVGNFFFATTDGVHTLVGYIGNEDDQELVLPNSYKGENYKIGNRVFENCTNLTSITIPDSVTSIGECAFFNCTNLTSITIPDSVTSIGEYAFTNCTNLTDITIPNSVTSIGWYAFGGCINLKTVVNLSDLKISKGSSSNGYVGYYAEKVIKADDQISNFVFATTDGIHSLVYYIRNEDDQELVLPNSYKGENYKIGNRVFEDCTNLTSITIPDSVTSIGEYAFYGCSNLTDITIPNSVTSIGGYAFNGCSNLTDITIPNSVTSIGGYAFDDCINLKTVVNLSDLKISKGSSSNGYVGYYAEKIINADEQIGNFFFATTDGVHTLVGYIGNEDDQELILPNSYKGENYKIGNRVFEDCTNLTSITIPDSVTSIGEYAFNGCINLKTVVNLSDLKIYRGYSFNGYVGYYAKKVIKADGQVGNFFFATTDGVHILVGYIGNEDNLVLPDNYRGESYKIGDYAFYGCTHLASITIPNSVVSIEQYAFYGCENMKTVVNLSDLEIVKGTSDYGYVGFYAEKVATKDDQIGNFFFATTDGVHSLIAYVRNRDDKKIVLPENYKGENYEIGNDVFLNCANLTSVTLSNSVTSIGKYAFSGCSNLTDITIPNSVTSIGWYAFDGCN